jgi:hypothetical protein
MQKVENAPIANSEAALRKQLASGDSLATQIATASPSPGWWQFSPEFAESAAGVRECRW